MKKKCPALGSSRPTIPPPAEYHGDSHVVKGELARKWLHKAAGLDGHADLELRDRKNDSKILRMRPTVSEEAFLSGTPLSEFELSTPESTFTRPT